MVSVTKRPAKRETSNDEERENREYRSRAIKLDIGGMQAKVGSYAGEIMTLMRIMPRMTRIQGKVTPAHTLEGFDPETGEPLILFVDSKLGREGKITRNFGGGLLETLGTLMTEEEFDEAVEILNDESGADFVYNFEEWGAVGGAYRLKDKYYGKTIVVGKECVKTKAGVTMHVFALDLPTDDDGNVIVYDTEAFQEAFEETVGRPVGEKSPSSSERHGHKKTVGKQEKPAEPARKNYAPVKGKSDSNGKSKKPTSNERSRVMRGGEEEEEFDDGEPEVEQPVKKPSSGKSAYEKAVDAEKSASKSNGKKKEKPSVDDYVSMCANVDMAIDQIVIGLMKNYDMTEDEAFAYVEEAVESMEEHAEPEDMEEPVKSDSKKETKQPVKTSNGNGKGSKSPINDTARSCMKEGMNTPEAFQYLSDKFPDATKSEIKLAMRVAGIVEA